MKHNPIVQNRRLRVKSLGMTMLLTFYISTVIAQEATLTTGSNAFGSGGSVSYSVGQITYITNTGTNGSVAQGVQQPYEISVVTGLEEAKDISLTVSVYPNPTTDFLILSIDKFEISNLSFQLYNIQGKLLQSEKITDNQTSIAVNNIVPASYFLKVSQGNKEIRIFKIVKSK